MSTQNLISAREAAKRRGVSRQAVYQAADRGTLNDYRTGNIRLIVVDDAFKRWLDRPLGDGTSPIDVSDQESA